MLFCEKIGQNTSRLITTEKFASWKRGVCALKTRTLEFQEVTKALEKTKLLVNFLYKTRRVNVSYLGG